MYIIMLDSSPTGHPILSFYAINCAFCLFFHNDNMPVPPSLLSLFDGLIPRFNWRVSTFVDFVYTLDPKERIVKRAREVVKRERELFWSTCCSNGCRKGTHLFALGKINILFLKCYIRCGLISNPHLLLCTWSFHFCPFNPLSIVCLVKMADEVFDSRNSRGSSRPSYDRGG